MSYDLATAGIGAEVQGGPKDEIPRSLITDASRLTSGIIPPARLSTATTPLVTDASDAIATTQHVADAIDALGGRLRKVHTLSANTQYSRTSQVEGPMGDIINIVPEDPTSNFVVHYYGRNYVGITGTAVRGLGYFKWYTWDNTLQQSAALTNTWQGSDGLDYHVMANTFHIPSYYVYDNGTENVVWLRWYGRAGRAQNQLHCYEQILTVLEYAP